MFIIFYYLLMYLQFTFFVVARIEKFSSFSFLNFNFIDSREL
jgi:hypothetical protein